MCLIALSAIVGVAQAGLGFVAQQQQYEAQQEAYNRNVEEANKALITKYDFDQLRIRQEQHSAASEMFHNNIEAAQASSTAAVSAGEGGVTGASVNAVMRDLAARSGRANAAVGANYDMTKSAIQASMESNRAEAQNRINAMPIPTKPSFLDAGIRMLGAVGNAYATHKENKY